MTAEDLIAAVPSNWDPKNGWSFKSYQRNYRYAPLLVIDGDVLPFNYLAAGRNAALTPTIIGVTRQEVDFSPGSSLYCARDLGVDVLPLLNCAIYFIAPLSAKPPGEGGFAIHNSQSMLC